MIDLALAVACSLAIAMIFKHVARRGLDRLLLLTTNYLAAFLISVAALQVSGFNPSTGLLMLGVGTGGLFIAGFFVLALAVAVAGMSLATAVMRISVVIPFVASWIIWNETPSGFQFAGLAVASAAFVLLSRRPRALPVDVIPTADPRELAVDVLPTADPQERIQAQRGQQPTANSQRTVLSVLLALFVLGGVIDTMMKTFDEAFAADHSRAAFMMMVFGVAFLVGLIIVAVRRQRPDLPTIIWGAALGAVNFGSVEFILRAIRELSGPFVFPANNILVVIGSALLGVLFWGERLSRRNWIGLGLAALALLLLNN